MRLFQNFKNQNNMRKTKQEPIQPETNNAKRTINITVVVDENNIEFAALTYDKWSTLELHALKSLIVENIDDVIRKRNKQTTLTECNS